MVEFCVTQDEDGDDRLLLQDNAGQFYRVRALGLTPPVGARLHGARPRLGFGLLMCSVSGQMFRVIYESTGSHAAIVLGQQPSTG